MPISVKYYWEETQDDITLKIPFKGQSAKKVDLFVADLVLKISYNPYLLDINLAKKIRTNSFKAVLKDGHLIVNVGKKVQGLWHKLVFDDGSKEDIKIRREESIQRREEEIQYLHENARSKKIEEDRMAVRKQMSIDSAEHQQIDDLKHKEKKEAEEKLYKSIAEWTLDDQPEPNIDNSPAKQQVTFQEECCNRIIPHDCNHQIDNEDDHNDIDRNEENDIFEVISIPTPPSYPSVRGASCIRFKHTPRIFKTPVRESTLIREKEFLIKNRPFLKYNKHFNTDCTDVSDADPFWLKKKGDEFYIAGDYMSAINAYTEAFEKDKNFLQALTNRSACYLYVGEAQRCILDSDEALALIKNDEFQTNLSASHLQLIHKKILIRVASAHCQSGGGLIHFEMALHSLKLAKDMDESDTLLSQDIERVNNILQSLKVKSKADILLSDGKIDDAIVKYNKVLSMEPTLIGAKINSATAHLLNGLYEECIALCGQVLEVFQSTGSCKNGAITPIGTIPLPGTLRRRQMVIACLHKRAEALSKLNRFDEAIAELKIVKTIISSYEDTSALKSEIKKLQKHCDNSKPSTSQGEQ